MNGLFGNYDPEQVGLLTLGASLLANSGPTTQPVGFGQALGGGLQAGRQAATQAQQFKDAEVLKQYQLSKLKREDEEAQQRAAIRSRIMGSLPQLSGVPMLPGHTPQVGVSDSSAAAMNAPWAASSNLPQQQATAPGGMNPLITQMLLSGDPGLQKLASEMIAAEKPIPVTEGGALMGRDGRIIGTRPKIGEGMTPVYGPNGQVIGVQPMPGYTGAIGGIRGAEEGAKARYDLVEVPVGKDGSRQQMTREQAAQLYAQSNQRRPIAPTETQHLGTTNRAEGNFSSLTALDNVPVGRTSPPAERAADQRFAETLSGEMAKQYGDLLKADYAAPKTISNYRQLGNLLSQVATGKYKGTTTDIKAAAKSLGFDLSALGIADDVAPAQAARALSNTLALELRNPAGGAGMPGALSDKDREFLIQSIPGLENDPRAIPLMIEYRIKLAEREQQVAKMARDYKKRTGRFDDGFYDELSAWSARNPLFTDADRSKITSRGPAPIPKTPANAGGFRVLGVEGR